MKETVGHDCPLSSANANGNEVEDTTTEETHCRKRDRSLFDESSHEEEEQENTKHSNKKMVSTNVDKDV